MDDADHEDDHAVEERSSSAKLSRALSVSSPVALVFERQSSIVSHPLSEQQGSAEYDQKQKKKLFRNRKDKVVLISVVLFYFSVFCAYGMIAPFFPGEVSQL